MEVRRGILGGVAERVLAAVALLLVLFVGYQIYQIPASQKAFIWSVIWRSTMWVVLAAAAPWSLKFFIKLLLEKGTNWAGVGAIAALTFVDILIGFFLLTGWPTSGWAWLAIVVALGVMTTYNYLVAEYLAEMAGG
ncbi:MAG: hypothetical protein D6744_08920 [Planctomycetota bacterium]|nr:MAG: hypothetical protein D6744_08920 [Planctomycetota bacterium]